MVGLLLSNFTSPGPRNFVHVTAIGGGGVKPSGAAPRAAPRPRPRFDGSGTLIFAPSSEIQTTNGRGTPTVPVYFSAIACGGPANTDPFGWNLSFGGVFLLAASSNGSTM